MRKYRNGKQSRESRSLSKYSPEYIQYRENRGGYSVKVGLCDITGDGEEDTITHAWRHPALGKLQICQSQAAIVAPGVPTNLQSSFVPTIPGVPTNLQSSFVPTIPGVPTNLQSSFVPTTPGVPTNLTSSVIPDIPGVPTNLTSSFTPSVPGVPTNLQSSFTPSAPGVPTNLQSQVQLPPLTNQLATGVNLEMLWAPSGIFTMGENNTSGTNTHESPAHQVTLTKGFYLGKYEVTQAQYEAVMTGNTNSLSATPSHFSGYSNRPVENVSWDDIQIFLTRLNTQQSASIPSGWAYALPTEAQWEYACRAGTTTKYSWGDAISNSDANFASNSPNYPNDVGQYAANPWGFFDMHGNVMEWTADRFGNYSSGSLTDPTGPTSGSGRVIRDGGYATYGAYLGSASRLNSGTQSYTHNSLGFRVALVH